jgi:hypothetical protein
MIRKKEKLCNFSLEYVIRKIQENKQGVDLKGAHQLLVYLVNVNLLGVSLNVVQKKQRISIRR